MPQGPAPALCTHGPWQGGGMECPPSSAAHPRLCLPPTAGLGCRLLPCLPCGPMGVWGPGHWGQRGVSTHRPKCCCAGATDGRLGLGGLGGPVGRLAAALFNKITDAGVALSSLSTRILLGRTARVLSAAGGATQRHFFWHVPLRWALARLSEFRVQGGKQDRATPPSGPERDRGE